MNVLKFRSDVVPGYISISEITAHMVTMLQVLADWDFASIDFRLHGGEERHREGPRSVCCLTRAPLLFPVQIFPAIALGPSHHRPILPISLSVHMVIKTNVSGETRLRKRRWQAAGDAGRWDCRFRIIRNLAESCNSEATT